jgi:putative FmdB family regulatory protein
MPLYEYVCADCKRRFDALRKMEEADAPIACVKCHSQNTTRAISVFFAQSEGKVIAGGNTECGSCTSGSCASCGMR